MYEEYHIVANQAISLYNKNLLNKEIMESLLEPFHCGEFDFNSGIYTAKDGTDAVQIICSVLMPKEYDLIYKKYSNINLNKNLKIKKVFFKELYDLWQSNIAIKFRFW